MLSYDPAFVNRKPNLSVQDLSVLPFATFNDPANDYVPASTSRPGTTAASPRTASRVANRPGFRVHQLGAEVACQRW